MTSAAPPADDAVSEGEEVEGGSSSSSDAQVTPRKIPNSDVTAVIVTHMRPTLAGDLTRMLIESEGLPPDRVIVVVNAVGGLDDPALESTVRMLRLPENVGPAGGFEAGMAEAFSDPTTRWAYLCEDDIVQFPLPKPRLADLVERAETRQAQGHRVGAIVAYGRDFVGRGAHTENVVPPVGTPLDLSLTAVGAWGATLVSRGVFDAGVVPDASLFIDMEDFDWYCCIKEAGFEVLVDAKAARAVEEQQSWAGRQEALQGRRPGDFEEPWRAYYQARNPFAMARRHGTPSWYAWHIAYSMRRVQRAHGRDERIAILRGLWDGATGRLGKNPRFVRQVGEWSAAET